MLCMHLESTRNCENGRGRDVGADGRVQALKEERNSLTLKFPQTPSTAARFVLNCSISENAWRKRWQITGCCPKQRQLVVARGDNCRVAKQLRQKRGCNPNSRISTNSAVDVALGVIDRKREQTMKYFESAEAA